MAVHHSSRRRALLISSALAALSVAAPAFAEDEAPVVVAPVEVTKARTIAETPASAETVTREDLQRAVNAVNAEDLVKYLPSLLVRKRHIGDLQAPLATRTSGVGSSARSLIYADGVLLSALIGNNNTSASPRWSLVQPEEVERVDVLYGPFAAAYPGNSVGAVVVMSTRMPTRLEGSVKAVGTWQKFSQYGVDDTFPARQLSATVGDRFGRLSLWLGAEHTESRGQPLGYATAVRPAATSTPGAPTTGFYNDVNRTGAAIVVLGATGFERQTQDNTKLKLAYDLTPSLRASYQVVRFQNRTDSGVRSFLRDAAGNPVYAGALNLGGYAYNVATSGFSGNVYRYDETHWAQAASLEDHAGPLTWRATVTAYDFDKDVQRTPTVALPGAATGGAGTIARLDGTGWRTADVQARWQAVPDHVVSFGAHADRFTLANVRYNTADWISGSPTTTASEARGRTRTEALWGEDAWSLSPDLELTLGARWESWRAYGGYNYALSPALSVRQPELSADKVSPKATLRWNAGADWTVTASYGRAYRFPTVSELYQAVTTGAVLTVPNPNLRAEKADSGELAFERADAHGRLRASLFVEDLHDALVSQSAPLVAGSTTLYSYVQNIDHVRTWGVEVVGERRDVLVRGLDLTGSVTFADPNIKADAAFPAAVGKRTPQVPRWRASAVATYRASDRLTLTLAGRYSSRSYGTIDNSDPVTHTYQGFEDYLVVDARALWSIAPHWSAAVGVDNLNNDDYFLFHPFPQRTAYAELRYSF